MDTGWLRDLQPQITGDDSPQARTLKFVLGGFFMHLQNMNHIPEENCDACTNT